MKRTALWLSDKVTEYEKKFGTIKAEWSPGVISPIQGSDLSGSNSESDTSGNKTKK